jgi:hypothetical protein
MRGRVGSSLPALPFNFINEPALANHSTIGESLISLTLLSHYLTVYLKTNGGG